MTRPVLMLTAALVSAGTALAQAPDPIIATPLPPVESESTPDQPPPVLQRAPRAPDTWLARPKALIQALDKVNARSTTLVIGTGQAATYQNLTITVRSCLERPPDQPADAAAFVTVIDKADPSRQTGLWLIRSAPAVSILQHPIYDLRVTGCGS